MLAWFVYSRLQFIVRIETSCLLYICCLITHNREFRVTIYSFSLTLAAQEPTTFSNNTTGQVYYVLTNATDSVDWFLLFNQPLRSRGKATEIFFLTRHNLFNCTNKYLQTQALTNNIYNYFNCNNIFNYLLDTRKYHPTTNIF